MSHKSEGRKDEIDLKEGDTIGVAGNHWNGFNKGRNYGNNRSAHQLNYILLTVQNQGTAVKKCVFIKRTIKVFMSYCRRCPRTSSTLSVTYLMVSLYLCSSGGNIHVKVEGP